MNNKGFANIILIVLVVILAGVAGYFALVKKSPEVVQQTNPSSPTQTQAIKSPTITSFKTKRVGDSAILYSVTSDGKETQTGLKVPYTWDTKVWGIIINIVVSPDRSLVTYNTYTPDSNNPFLMSFYVAGVDGQNVRRIGTQTWPEGSGQIIDESLRWLDSSHVAYSIVTIGGECEECEYQGEIRTYSIDINKGTTSLIQTQKKK